jgi:hypothetical protein
MQRRSFLKVLTGGLAVIPLMGFGKKLPALDMPADPNRATSFPIFLRGKYSNSGVVMAQTQYELEYFEGMGYIREPKEVTDVRLKIAEVSMPPTAQLRTSIRKRMGEWWNYKWTGR